MRCRVSARRSRARDYGAIVQRLRAMAQFLRRAVPPRALGGRRRAAAAELSAESACTEPVRLIPAIDLKAGHCVRLLHGDFDAETRYGAEPAALLAKYRALRRRLAARGGSGRRHATAALGNRAIIAQLAAQSAVKLQVGGGLRDIDAVTQMLDAGVGARGDRQRGDHASADRCRTWLEHFGPERMALAFDVRLDESGTPRVATHGWQQQSELSLWERAGGFQRLRPSSTCCAPTWAAMAP